MWLPWAASCHRNRHQDLVLVGLCLTHEFRRQFLLQDHCLSNHQRLRLDFADHTCQVFDQRKNCKNHGARCILCRPAPVLGLVQHHSLVDLALLVMRQSQVSQLFASFLPHCVQIFRGW